MNQSYDRNFYPLSTACTASLLYKRMWGVDSPFTKPKEPFSYIFVFYFAHRSHFFLSSWSVPLKMYVTLLKHMRTTNSFCLIVQHHLLLIMTRSLTHDKVIDICSRGIHLSVWHQVVHEIFARSLAPPNNADKEMSTLSVILHFSVLRWWSLTTAIVQRDGQWLQA